eukprot:CAMPEP_0113474826 /NCGR_PEP_ID=MMETSP0014_2-20120614/18795_1 /TAXON_ID=2857 /ORGANISM="Nitzschia sp." /LENGTH=272 /DNA_ID=CAMNT_0000367707 /DNA_START=367 /DNA_END=1185 /DNA_ORIENTATION=+ /assembly_acc=CAM_ASM_000159
MKIDTKNCITTSFSPTGSATATTNDEIIIRPNRFVQLEAESRHRPPFFRSSTTFSSACSSAHDEVEGEVEGTGVENTFMIEETKTSSDDRYYISGSDDDTDEDTDKEEEEEQGRVVKCRPLLIMTPVKVSARQQQREQSPGAAPAPAACDMDVLATEFHKLVSITSSSSSSSSVKKTMDKSIVVVKPDAAPSSTSSSSSSSSSIKKTTKKKKSINKKKQQDAATSVSLTTKDEGEDHIPPLGRVDGNHFSYVSCTTSPVKRSMRIKQNPKYN